MAEYTSTRERFVGGALVKAGEPFTLPKGVKPSPDMQEVENKPPATRKRKDGEPQTLSELSELQKGDPVA